MIPSTLVYRGRMTVDGKSAPDAQPTPTQSQPSFQPRTIDIYIDTKPSSIDGTERYEAITELEKHCAFFDQDHDGIIWPSDTFRGFYQLGYHLFWCLLAATTLHVVASYYTSSTWYPDPFLRIYLRNIRYAKHTLTDTGAYDTEGHFVSKRFDEIFSRYDREGKGGLTWWDGMRMLKTFQWRAQPIGGIGAFAEFTATYLLVWPQDGIITRDALRAVYDGSLFFEVAEREKSRSQFPFSGFFKENKPK